MLTGALQAFLAFAILLYELLPGRRTRSSVGDDEDMDPDDPGMTAFEALAGWFARSNTPLTIGVFLLTFGTYLTSSQDIRSTFFCSKYDHSAVVIAFQWLGLALDAAIAILAWRILAWARTTKSRLRTLSGILLASSVTTGLLYSALTLYSTRAGYQFQGLDSLYFFDVVVDGLTFSVCLISTSLLATEGSPLSLASIISFFSGFFLAARQTFAVGTWENLSPWTTWFTLNLLCAGFSLFAYANNIRFVIFLHRALVVTLVILFTVFATIYLPIKASQSFDKHPLERIIYDTRVEADRWLVYASVSDSLPVAVQEYKERNAGRDPPPKFDVWYSFAKERNSVIMDHFPQMKKDLLPFWGISPSKLRENIRQAASEPDMVLLKVQKGKPHHNLAPGSPYTMVMDELVGLVKQFSKHLPDMELAINMDERPRVLSPWHDVQRSANAANRGRVSKILPRGAGTAGDKMPEFPTNRIHMDQTSVNTFREMTAVACPPGTKARGGSHWDIRDLCISCADPQSRDQFIINWPLAQDICHQSDLFHLHSFFMVPPKHKPLQELLPIFSRAKTDSYRDILLPLRRPIEPREPTTGDFGMKWKKLFWRGKVDRLDSSHEVLRGGHQERLVHAANTASGSDKTRLLVPTGNNNNRWQFTELPTTDLNALLEMDVGFTAYNPHGPGVDSGTAVGNEPGTKPDAEPLRHQYVMVLDTDDGPPHELLRTIRSNSVPFYGSIFKEWYSDRLLPWIHFVPVDLRFHSLHNTIAYFLGIEKKDRSVMLRGRQEDGKWIADQGKRWAEKALRREDMEVYLFRLLLEWGRIIDDKRDELGFVLPEKNKD